MSAAKKRAAFASQAAKTVDLRQSRRKIAVSEPSRAWRSVDHPSPLSLHRAMFNRLQLQDSISRSMATLDEKDHKVNQKKGDKKMRLARRIGLRTEHLKALNTSWQRVGHIRQSRGALPLVQRALDQLCRADKCVNTIFVQNAFIQGLAGDDGGLKTKRDHARFLVWLLDRVMNAMGDTVAEQEVVNLLTDIGQKHTKLRAFGLANKHWDIFGERLVEVLTLNEAVRRCPSAGKAWTIFIAGVTDMIVGGFKKGERNSSSSSVGSNHSPTTSSPRLLPATPASKLARTPETTRLRVTFAEQSRASRSLDDASVKDKKGKNNALLWCLGYEDRKISQSIPNLGDEIF